MKAQIWVVIQNNSFQTLEMIQTDVRFFNAQPWEIQVFQWWVFEGGEHIFWENEATEWALGKLQRRQIDQGTDSRAKLGIWKQKSLILFKIVWNLDCFRPRSWEWSGLFESHWDCSLGSTSQCNVGFHSHCCRFHCANQWESCSAWKSSSSTFGQIHCRRGCRSLFCRYCCCSWTDPYPCRPEIFEKFLSTWHCCFRNVNNGKKKCWIFVFRHFMFSVSKNNCKWTKFPFSLERAKEVLTKSLWTHWGSLEVEHL